MKTAKKIISLILALILILSVSAAMAKTVEPEDTETERLAGKTISATVGAYDAEFTQTFTVTLYEEDRFDNDDIAALAVGDLLLAGGYPHVVREVTKSPDGDPMVICEDGEEIVFTPAPDDDEMIARSTDDDRLFMHAFRVVHLPAAADIVLEDLSDPDSEEAVMTTGLEAILAVKEEKETTSIGFDFYATTITLNENLEIVKIHQVFDVAQ